MSDVSGGSRIPRTYEEFPAHVYLQPIAAPSVLGLFAFAGATFMVAAHMAHWYGGANTDVYLAAFAATFGGMAQFTAGMWAFKARDAVATAMHGMWGAFWIAYGILEYSFVSGRLARPTGAFPALGYWFIVLAAITWMGAWAASAENRLLSAVLVFLAAGSTLAAIADLANVSNLQVIAGYCFIISAVMAWYTASAMMLEGAFHRRVIASGKVNTESAIMPGEGEPGVIRGQ